MMQSMHEFRRVPTDGDLLTTLIRLKILHASCRDWAREVDDAVELLGLPVTGLRINGDPHTYSWQNVHTAYERSPLTFRCALMHDTSFWADKHADLYHSIKTVVEAYLAIGGQFAA